MNVCQAYLEHLTKVWRLMYGGTPYGATSDGLVGSLEQIVPVDDHSSLPPLGWEDSMPYYHLEEIGLGSGCRKHNRRGKPRGACLAALS